MSRDFTPRDLWEARTFNLKEKNVDMKNIDFDLVDQDGNKTPVHSDTYKYLLSKYELLTFLFNSSLEELYANYKSEKFETFLEKMENVLKNIVEEKEIEDKYQLMKDWYYGKLDPNFYYNDENNEKFKEFLIFLYKGGKEVW